MLDRTIAPPFVQSTAFDLLKPQRLKLPNGIELLFVGGSTQDVIKIEVVFHAGRWYERHWGAAYFAAQLLNKGTSKRTSFELARIFDLYGAHVELMPGLDYVSVALYGLTKQLKPVLELLDEILTAPSFPEKELEQTTSIYLQNLKINEEKTSFLAAKHFRKHLFGDTHPYGKELEESDIRKLSVSELKEHFRTMMVKPTVFVSGKIDKDSREDIERTFAKWDSGTIAEKRFVTPSLRTERIIVEKAESVQSSIRLGTHSVLRNDPDYSSVIFASHILGGYFGSRLMKNIREDKGLTYGIYSSVQPLRNGSYLSIGADVNADNVNLTFDEIRKELKRLRSEPVSEDELTTAKNHFIGSLQSEINNPFAHADKIKTLQLFSLPEDYYQQMIDRIARTTSTDVMNTAERYINEDKFFELSVG